MLKNPELPIWLKDLIQIGMSAEDIYYEEDDGCWYWRDISIEYRNEVYTAKMRFDFEDPDYYLMAVIDVFEFTIAQLNGCWANYEKFFREEEFLYNF